MRVVFSEYSHLVDLIYQAALDRNAWSPVTDRLADFARATVCQISSYDGLTRTASDIAPRLAPEALRSYQEFWVRHNPLIAAGRRQPVGAVCSM